MKGGLFDLSLTGGLEGNRWAQITLATKVPHPVMEEPILRVLDLTKPELQQLIARPRGPEELERRLDGLDLDAEIDRSVQDIRSTKGSRRDRAVKRLRFLEMARRTGVTPEQWMVSKVPVIPPRFRPVSLVDGVELTSDANLLYRELFDANEVTKDAEKTFGDAGEERVALYGALKALQGLGDPIGTETRQKKVAGFLTHIFGKGSAKFGMVQRKMLSTTVDQVGRAAILPDPGLDMDEVGLPESIAWDAYRPHVLRRLVRQYAAGGKDKASMAELARWVAREGSAGLRRPRQMASSVG